MPPRTRKTRASATSKSASDQPGPAESTSATISTTLQSPATGTNSGTAASKRAPQRKAPRAKRLCNNTTSNTPEESTLDQSTNPEGNIDNVTALNRSDDLNRTQNSNNVNSTQETTQQTRLGSDEQDSNNLNSTQETTQQSRLQNSNNLNSAQDLNRTQETTQQSRLQNSNNLNSAQDSNRTQETTQQSRLQNSNNSNSAQDLNRTQETTQQPRLRPNETKPTFDNYQSLMNSWPPGRIKQHLDDNKPSNRTRPSHEIKERVKFIYRRFQHELLMLAMVGELSETTIKSIIPGLNAKKPKGLSCYTLFLEYYSDCLAEPMPLKGQDDIDGESMLAERNKKNGDHWQSLTADEKAVFDPTIFFALAGVPNPLAPLESDEGEEVEDDENERGDSFVPVPKVHKLSVEEDSRYRPIYERVVDLKKVEAQIAKPPTGPSTTQLQRKSKTAIEKIAHNLACEANRLDFAYYLVATSTVTPNNANDHGWLKEFTTHPQVATWANKTSHLATVFATYSQGQSMAKAIHLANNKPAKKRHRPDKQQPSDKIKVDLGRLLAALTQKTLGYLPNQGFPQTADPANEIKKRSLPIRMVLMEGSRLTDEKVAVGFKKMRSATRSDWVNDITDGKFCLVKLSIDSEDTIGEPVALDSKDIEKALVTPAREMAKVVELDNNQTTGEPTVSQERRKKGKRKQGSDSSDSEDDSEEED